MRVLLSNKFYYPRGGDCIYTLELEKLLRAGGDEVAVFAMQFQSNLKNDYLKYFPSEVDYSTGGLSNRINQIIRPIRSKEVVRNFSNLLNDFKPDVVHLNNIHSQLSPVLAEISFKKNIPVVWTLHDYKLLCPRYDCLRNGKPCELCFSDKKNVIKHSCMKGSKVASFLAYTEAVFWNISKLEKYTDRFICPSNFLKKKMIEGGLVVNKLSRLSNFIDIRKLSNTFVDKENYLCYVGRLSHEKGLYTLLEAIKDTGYQIKIAGTGPLEGELKNKFQNKNIEYLGFQNWEEVKELIGKAKCMIIPSEWYENNPLSVIEALCLGTPVIGANIGGIPELISSNENGMLFESRNVVDLREKIKHVMKSPQGTYNYNKIAIDARQRYSSEQYYDQVMEIYKTVIKNKKCRK